MAYNYWRSTPAERAPKRRSRRSRVPLERLVLTVQLRCAALYLVKPRIPSSTCPQDTERRAARETIVSRTLHRDQETKDDHKQFRSFLLPQPSTSN